MKIMIGLSVLVYMVPQSKWQTNILNFKLAMISIKTTLLKPDNLSRKRFIILVKASLGPFLDISKDTLYTYKAASINAVQHFRPRPSSFMQTLQ